MEPHELTAQWMEFWKYAGTAAAILAAVMGLAIVHYWKVLLPRAQATTEDQRLESRARVDSLKKMAESSERSSENHLRQTAILNAIQETQRHHGDTLEDHTKRLSEIRRWLDKSDPDQHVIK